MLCLAELPDLWTKLWTEEYLLQFLIVSLWCHTNNNMYCHPNIKMQNVHKLLALKKRCFSTLVTIVSLNKDGAVCLLCICVAEQHTISSQ